MADVTWPAELPDKAVLGWTEKLGANTVRSQNEVGPASVRPRATSAPTTCSMPFILTEDQADTLMDFYESRTSGTASGARTFDGLLHPRKDTVVVWRFLEPPDITCVERDVYTVTLSLEIIP